jgi:hypothetical protein
MNNSTMSNAGDQGASFIYTGQEGADIPWDVIHVRVNPTVRRIEDWAFNKCSQLAIVILGEGVEEIGQWASFQCT